MNLAPGDPSAPHCLASLALFLPWAAISHHFPRYQSPAQMPPSPEATGVLASPGLQALYLLPVALVTLSLHVPPSAPELPEGRIHVPVFLCSFLQQMFT